MWEPIHKFAGIFDGLGHTVSGLYRDNRNTENGIASFFSGLGNGDENRTIEVRNLGVIGSFFRAQESTGAIVGYVHSGLFTFKSYVLIENCWSHVRMETELFYHHIGGIAGEVSGHATIKDCSASGLVVGNSNDMGGIAGLIEVRMQSLKDQPVIVENCSSNVRVSGNPRRAGGIVGNIDGWAWIKNGKNYGEVDGDTVGGIVGTASGSPVIVNSFNKGPVVGNTVGGIAGGLKDYAAVMNCYNQGAVSGRTVGGLFGYVNLYSGYIAGAYSSYLVDAPWSMQTENALIGSHKGMSLKNLESMIENVFYLEQSSADSVGKMLPEELFEDGTVAYLLRNFTYRVNDLDGSIWGQTIGVDPYPVFKDAITGLRSS